MYTFIVAVSTKIPHSVAGLAGFCRKVEKTVFSAVKTGLAKIVFARIFIKVNFCCTMFFLCTYSKPVVYVFLHSNLW